MFLRKTHISKKTIRILFLSEFFTYSLYIFCVVFYFFHLNFSSFFIFVFFVLFFFFTFIFYIFFVLVLCFVLFHVFL